LSTGVDKVIHSYREARPMANVRDVAAYILGAQGTMTTMKLQKLCYYSQGWSLAWDEEPLFSEPIQAWANGPVVYDLYLQHRGSFRVSPGDIAGDPSALTTVQRDTVDAVLEGYGDLSGQQLSDKTHAERPWLTAREGCEPGERSTTEISLEVLQDYFGGLASVQGN
jgi:uncharacterized phage-associated protein